MLKGKTIVLGVTGSIAAYKIANLASMLVKLHADVHVIMTKNATQFITPVTFETLTNNRCQVDTFDRNFEFHVTHVSLAQKADVMMIAPASANVIAKLAQGIADDMLTTVALACKAPMIISPAMNTNMYENPIVQDNIEILKKYGKKVIEPASGMLACRAVGKGKMPEPEVLLQHILYAVHEKDLLGKKILISAGPTREPIDPVRFISNHSTGKMGYALAKDAAMRGADVTLVTGPCSIDAPMFLKEIVPVTSAQEMHDAVLETAKQQDVIIMTAAVADYRPAQVSDEKVKKKDADLSIALVRTKDILSELGENRTEGQILIGFSMETQNMLENSRAKLAKKHVDMIVANNLKVAGAGFGTDTNIITMITAHDEVELPIMSKEEAADEILNRVAAMTKHV